MRFLLALAFLLPCLAPAPVAAQTAAETIDRPYWQHRAGLFRRLPDPAGEIVFLGDSITEGCPWNELTGLPNVTNRGISGDTAWGILARLDEVTSGHPAKIFLMIGTNDLARGQTVDEVYEKIAEIVGAIRQQSPRTRVVLQSVLPVADRDGWNYQNAPIRALNEKLERFATQTGSTWLDVAPALQDAKGQLDGRFSLDGLHLNGDGYLAWYAALQPHLVP